jgi:hypothetical protein
MDTSTTAPRFVDNNDGTITDTRTGLMWSRNTLNAEEADQPACDALATACTLGGHSDWHLPTREELVTLIDDTRYSPAIDTDAFLDIKNDWYWTSTPTAWSASGAWYVNFYYGYVDYFHRNDRGFALAVRRAGQ